MSKKLFIITLFTSLAACSSVKSRVKEHQSLFNSFPPQVQSQIQSGRIDRGFNEDMVYLALGEPSDKSSIAKKTADGASRSVVIWKYPLRTPPEPREHQSSGLAGGYSYPVIGPGPVQQPVVNYERRFANVEFENGKVVGWDPLLQDDPERLKAEIH
jgi:hypothetical protein